MKDKTPSSQKQFERLLLESEPEALNHQTARGFLESKGVDVDKYIQKGLLEIKEIEKRISNFPKGGIVGESHQGGEVVINRKA